jgi:predicted transcriptional regulator
MILRRSKTQVFFDILNAIQKKNGKIKKTHIMYNANLTHERLEKYLETLLINGFLERTTVKNETFYTITEQGFKFMTEIRKLKKMTEAFGIPV